MDSNNLINSNCDSTSMYKSNRYAFDEIFHCSNERISLISNLNNRANSNNPIFSIQTTSQDMLNRTDNGSDYTNSPTTIAKRRTFTNSALFSNPSSSDHLSLKSKLIYSQSANNLDTSGGLLSNNHADESLDVTPTNIPTKPMFDLLQDQQLDNTDSLYDEQDRRSQLSGSMFDDQTSIASPGRKRKQFLSSKLLKPFQNIRLRKKSNAS